METFKAILRSSLELRAKKIFLQAGQEVVFYSDEGRTSGSSFGLLGASWIQDICLALSHQNQDCQGSENHGLTTGSFQLHGVGQVYLAAKGGDYPELYLFMPPSGEQALKEFVAESSAAALFQITLEPSQPSFEAPLPSSPVSEGQDQESSEFQANQDMACSLKDRGNGHGPVDFSGPTAPSNLNDPNFSEAFSREVVELPAGQDELFGHNDRGGGELPVGVGLQFGPLEGSGLPAGGVREDKDNPGGEPSAGPIDSLQVPPPEERLGSEEGDYSQSGFVHAEPPPPPVDLLKDCSSIPAIPHEDKQAEEKRPSGPAFDEELMFAEQVPGTIFEGTGHNPVDRILKQMVAAKASDLHLTNNQPVIMRVDGDICRLEGDCLNSSILKEYLLPMIPELKKKEFLDSWDIDFAYEISGIGRFRVNMFRDHNGPGAVLRHIPDRVISAEDLGLPQAITGLCGLSKGLILVTGATGSGKSTTLAAMLDVINKQRHEHILTIEDPIEFIHEQKKCLINQREVGKHTASFGRALRAALREDPDVVLVGELRDLETTSIALKTAETGHLVFGTLHTNTAVSTVDRVVDQFPSEEQRIIRNMLASTMKGVIAQTLCKRQSGGRVAAYEILIPNEAVSSMVREGKNHMIANFMQTQQADGNMLMNDSLTRLVASGLVDYQEAWAKAIDKKDFEEQARRKKVSAIGR